MNLVRSHRMVTAVVFAALLLAVARWSIAIPAEGAQAPACLHGDDETPTELTRRRAAVAFMRAVNTAQPRVYATAKTYRPISELPNLPAVPAGFTALAVATADVYAVAVKDTRDPCGFALFSDQTGLIYSGRPLQ